jgi:hypothetical protein
MEPTRLRKFRLEFENRGTSQAVTAWMVECEDQSSPI